MIIQIVLGSLFLARLAWMCWRAASGRGRQSRLGWLQSAGEAALLLIVARLLLNWSMIPPLLWLLPVLIIAATAMLVVRRWPGLASLPAGRRPAVSIGRSVIGWVAVVGCAGLLLA